jgi:hypothetical protein
VTSRELVAIGTAALVLAACGGGGGSASAPSPSPATTADAVASPTAAAVGCSAPVHPPLQGGAHVLGDTDPPVPYSSTPATSGWHATGAPRTGVIPADDPLADPQIVLTIEVGHVVAAYDPARLDGTDVAELEDLATGTHADRLTVTPYEGADAPLTLVAWGILQSCEDLDREALDAFVAEHADPDAHAH